MSNVKYVADIIDWRKKEIGINDVCSHEHLFMAWPTYKVQKKSDETDDQYEDRIAEETEVEAVEIVESDKNEISFRRFAGDNSHTESVKSLEQADARFFDEPSLDAATWRELTRKF